MLTPDYIIGLVDGEGSFTAYVRGELASKKRRAKVEPRFFLKLKAVDKPLLDALKDYFRCGNVYIQKDHRAGHSLCWRYEVANRAHIRDTIIPFFQKHKLNAPSKRKDFTLFCRIMQLIDQGAHFSDAGMEKIRILKAQMH